MGFKKGHKINLGRHWTKEMKKNRKGMSGKKHSKETKRKLSLAKKGKGLSNKGVKKPHMCGKNNSNWRGGTVKLSKLIRNSDKYAQWRSDIYTRDNWTCQTCGNRGGIRIEAHHIKEFYKLLYENNIESVYQAEECEELWDINNGVTLCCDCHNLTKKGRYKKLTR